MPTFHRSAPAAALELAAGGLDVLNGELRSIADEAISRFEPIARRELIIAMLSPGRDEYGDETPPLIDEATAQRLLEMP